MLASPMAATAVTYIPGDQGWGRGKHPVITVSWDDAKAYTARLSCETGKIYRLLSETEWNTSRAQVRRRPSGGAQQSRRKRPTTTATTTLLPAAPRANSASARCRSTALSPTHGVHTKRTATVGVDGGCGSTATPAISAMAAREQRGVLLPRDPRRLPVELSTEPPLRLPLQ
jgi:Sulfatase-modifying factor enzyme 1